MDIWDVVILAIIEGLTEFLPVSSTGHLIITSSLLGIEPSPVTKIFMINIQLGAILSVFVLYWKRFFNSYDFYLKLLIAFLPAVFFGLLLGEVIDRLLESVVVVAIGLIIGGIVLVLVDRIFKAKIDGEEISNRKAFVTGLFQCLAMIPGVSRSAATIIGGMTQNMTKKKAAEFSFFLAVPTMFGATAYKLYQEQQLLTGDNLFNLVIGNIVAFLVAIIAIKSFIGFVSSHGFKVFGYYRILAGGVILILVLLGYDLRVV